jgi:hypothetical protein
MNGRVFFRVGLLALVVSIFALVHWDMARNGVPQIELAVRREAAALARTDDSLHSLELGQTTKRRIVGSGVDLTGDFWFDGSYSNQSWDVVVYWRKSDTNAPIDKIEVCSTYQEPQTIWSRK